MSIPMKCPNGHLFISGALLVTDGSNNTFNISEPCPICGAYAQSIDGTYSHKDGQITEARNIRLEDRQILAAILKAVRSPAVSPRAAEVVKTVSSALQDGTMDTGQAEEAISNLGPFFSAIIALARKSGFDINTVLALIGIALAWYAIYDSNVTGNQAHSDALRIDQSIRDETEAIQHLEKVLVEQRAASQPRNKASKRNRRKADGSNQGPNRHERRKASAIAKQKK